MHPGVFDSFDIPASRFAEDVQAIYPSTLEAFGMTEWKKVVMTNEIHGHLGIYSTIGAKMGVRVREIAEAAGFHGEPHVVSFAGSTPPVSCFGDGIQISTGATIGHGLISIAEVPSEGPSPKAEFRYESEGRTLTITASLKAEYQSILREDIRTGVSRYGHAPEYWAYIRSLAIRYWKEWSRFEIFDIQQ